VNPVASLSFLGDIELAEPHAFGVHAQFFDTFCRIFAGKSSAAFLRKLQNNKYCPDRSCDR
jgi:hypothetical protein